MPWRRVTLEFCRQALLIFLETPISLFSNYDTARIHHLQPLLAVTISYVPHILSSKISCIVMWPLMIIRSCLVEEDHRKATKDVLLHNQCMMRNTAQASDLLELLWLDQDEYAIGPYGLDY